MLLDLKNEMERELAGVSEYGLWFHESLLGVDGYLGTGPIMFVAQRPSTATTNTPAFQRFYKLLREYGFAESHVTDLVKERMTAGSISKKQLDRNWPFFMRELSIVQPSALIAMKSDVFRTLSKRPGHELRILKMLHYSWRNGSPDEVERRFRSEFERVKRELASDGSPEGLDLPEPEEDEDGRVRALWQLHNVRKTHYSEPLRDAIERCYEAGCSHKHVMRTLRHGWDPHKALTHRRGGAGSDDD